MRRRMTGGSLVASLFNYRPPGFILVWYTCTVGGHMYMWVYGMMWIYLGVYGLYVLDNAPGRCAELPPRVAPRRRGKVRWVGVPNNGHPEK